MGKLLETLMKYIGLPLVEKLGKLIVSWIKEQYDEYQMKKEVDKKIKELKSEGKSKDEIRSILRDIAP